MKFSKVQAIFDIAMMAAIISLTLSACEGRRQIRVLISRVQALEACIQRADLNKNTGEVGLDRSSMTLEGGE